MTHLWRPLCALLHQLDCLSCMLLHSACRDLARLDGAVHEIERAPLVSPRHLEVEARVDCVVDAVDTKPVILREYLLTGWW